MWEWRIFSTLERTSTIFSKHKELENALSSRASEIRLDEYMILDSPELGLKFRDIRTDSNMALLELKILLRTNKMNAELWEKPIIRYASTHPAKEVIYNVLSKEKSKYSTFSEKINWILNCFSRNEVNSVTIKKKRKKIYLYDPNTVIKAKVKIPRAPVNIEYTVITINQVQWKTIAIESYSEQTIKGILDNMEINNQSIISGYPEFIRGQLTVNNSQQLR